MRPRRETIPIPGHDLVIQVTDDQSRTLLLPDSMVAYHSASGAAAETEHVYLSNSGTSMRLQGGQSTSVLEIGMGTGLGMLMTLDAAIAAGTPLRFETVECNVLERAVLSELHLQRHLKMPGLWQSFLDFRDSLGASVDPGQYCWRPQDDQEVWLICGDALNVTFAARGPFDAVYFDPFAPSENPSLWQAPFLRKMRTALSADGRLVTYCVNRQVRESLTEAGFEVRRVRGPRGGKREVLIATASSDHTV